MNLKKEIWTKEDYKEFKKYLKEIGEENYKIFHKKLTPTKYEILGIRVPIQRKIAKEISKGNVISFLALCETDYYEEINIEGFVIANLKENFDLYFDKFIEKIDNWATCDSFCNSIKQIEKNKEKYFKKITELLKETHPFKVRVGVVLLLSYYVEEKYIKEIILKIEEIKREEYYINMAIAWLIAECFIKYPKITMPYIKENNLSSFTQNKTISKIRDSYRVSKEIKEELKKYRK